MIPPDNCLQGADFILQVCECDMQRTPPESCYFCGDPNIGFSNPEASVSIPGGGTFSCADIEVNALTGRVLAHQCQQFADTILSVCTCSDESPVDDTPSDHPSTREDIVSETSEPTDGEHRHGTETATDESNWEDDDKDMNWSNPLDASTWNAVQYAGAILFFLFLANLSFIACAGWRHEV